MTGTVVQKRRCTQDGGEYWEVCRECSPLFTRLSQIIQLVSTLPFSCSSQTGLVLIIRIIMKIMIKSTPLPARLSLASRLIGARLISFVAATGRKSLGSRSDSRCDSVTEGSFYEKRKLCPCSRRASCAHASSTRAKFFICGTARALLAWTKSPELHPPLCGSLCQKESAERWPGTIRIQTED